jgi:hypothetical protein
MDAWVTLSEPAIRLHGHCLAQGEYVFPGRRGGPHSDATLLAPGAHECRRHGASDSEA